MQPVFTRADARAYDRHCMEVLGIPGVALMERASRGCAHAAVEMLPGPSARVCVVCGPGQNGGDGYAVARMLAEAGHAVEIRAVGEPRPGTDASVMRAKARDASVPIRAFDACEAAERLDLVVDGLFGTGLDRPVGGEALRAIAWMNARGAPILSIDVPSGLDCDTGRPLPDAVRAARTVTMVACKRGFLEPAAGPFIGRVEVVPIGGPDPGVFSRSSGPAR
jgi:hydroxyethylthiazole kinase-like uncharacterized protein yjeF